MNAVAEPATRTRDIKNWLDQQVTNAGAKGLVFGLSGGVDSACVARLAQLACPGNVLGVVMPCHSNPDDELHASLVADTFEIPTIRLDLAPTFEMLREHAAEAILSRPDLPLNGKGQQVHGNLKPRLRMTSLYFVANSLGYLVAGTGNRSELVMGYFTKYGDGGVDVLPLGRLVKSQVRELARELGVPEPIIAKPPSAGLWQDQTDEGEMGVTYEQIEQYLADPSRLDSTLSVKIEQMMGFGRHKLSIAPMPPDA